MEDFHLQNNFLQYRGHKMSGECSYRYADLLRSFPAPSAWRCSQCVNFPAWSFPTHLRLSVINPSITTIIIIKCKMQNNYYNPSSQSLGTSWSTVCSLNDSGVNLWGANHLLMPRMPLSLITTNCVSCSVLGSYVSEIPHCRTSSFVTVLSQEASASWISRNARNPKKVYAGAVWGDGPKSFFNFALTKNNLRPRNSNSTQRGHWPSPCTKPFHWVLKPSSSWLFAGPVTLSGEYWRRGPQPHSRRRLRSALSQGPGRWPVGHESEEPRTISGQLQLFSHTQSTLMTQCVLRP